MGTQVSYKKWVYMNWDFHLPYNHLLQKILSLSLGSKIVKYLQNDNNCEIYVRMLLIILMCIFGSCERVSVKLCICLFVCLSMCLSVCECDCVCVSVSVCVSVCVCVFELRTVLCLCLSDCLVSRFSSSSEV